MSVRTIAAAALLLAGYTGNEPLIDPMCGSGTFSLEAALMAKSIPPAWFREFAFMGWPLALADTVVLMDQGRIVQIGTPQDINLKPETAFAGEFLGVSNQLEGEAGGGRLTIAGQTVPYAGTVQGRATVIIRASDIHLDDPTAAARPGTLVLTGSLEESLFLGAHYRHYVRLGSVIVMADSPEPRPAGSVRLVMPANRVQVYAR